MISRLTFCIALALGLYVWIPGGIGAARAGSQSSNSSSNCSGGRCTHVETYVHEDRRGSHGYTRVHRWREGAQPGYRWHDDDDD